MALSHFNDGTIQSSSATSKATRCGKPTTATFRDAAPIR